ncbi:ATP-binding SpoIIE family protein phosphatase [Schlesneria sp. T3-172]|uniref:ATP-binding SpoIIE family protein phosphatase n=1 Tax=Schlesneria sphaerica TaxID=3373610 RepID=UPI0037C7C414
MIRQLAIDVVEESQIGEVRRRAVSFGKAANFGEIEHGKLAIVVNELAQNLVKHAQNGQILLQIAPLSSNDEVEVIAIDSGPGIQNIGQCLQDGYSTAGTMGMGLGAVQRQSMEFDIYSQVATGTVMVARVGSERNRASRSPFFDVGSVSIAMPGEEVCGDAWACRTISSKAQVIVADGLGHGPLAQEAALCATNSFQKLNFVDSKSSLQSAHLALSGTRGAAAAVACVDVQLKKLQYAGVGNISGNLIIGDRVYGLISHNGIVGVQQRKTEQYEYPLGGDGLLIMHSDGLRTRWSLTDHPGLRTRHPALIAAVLYRDYCRTRDDATVVVTRFQTVRE